MEIHEYAKLFPQMREREMADLMTSIAEHGQQHPIIVYQGKILDGRNRFSAIQNLRAMQQMEIEPIFQNYKGSDPLQYVIDSNLYRRHLTTSQRSMVAAELANMNKGDNQHTQICVTSQSDAAKALNVSQRSVSSAQKVMRECDNETVDAVRNGGKTVSGALSELRKPAPNITITFNAEKPDLNRLVSFLVENLDDAARQFLKQEL